MKKFILFVLFCVVLSPAFLKAQTPFWHQTNGPLGGTMRDITIDSSGRIILWTDGSGVFISSDNGDSWHTMNKGLPDLIMREGACTPNGFLFSRNANYQVFRLNQNSPGAQWEEITPTLARTVNVDNMLINPKNGDIFLAAYQLGVLLSSDNGTTWTPKKINLKDVLPNGKTDSIVFFLAMDAQSNLYAALSFGSVFRSTDRGDSWTKFSTRNPGTNSISAFAVAPNGNVVVGNYENTDSSMGGKMYVTSDMGVTWKQVYQRAWNTLESRNHIDKIISIPNTNLLYANAHGPTLLSIDNGLTWTVMDTNKRGNETFSMAGRGNILFQMCEPAGAFLSLDSGKTWTEKNKGLIASLLYGIGINSKQELIGFTEYGLWLSTNNGNDWQRKQEYGETYYPSLLIDKNDNLIVGTDRGIFRSKDNGQTLEHLSNNLAPNITNNLILQIGQNASGTLFCSSGEKAIGFATSSDDGDTWTQIPGFPDGTLIQAFAFGVKDTIIAVTGGTDYYRSVDNGLHWDLLSSNNLGTKQLLILPDGSYLGLTGGSGGGIARSTDAATTWTTIFPPDNTYPQFNKFIFMMIDIKGNIIVTTDSGVYRSLDAAFSKWQLVNSRLTIPDFPNYSAQVSQIVENKVDHRYYAASLALGVFQSAPDFDAVNSSPSLPSEHRVVNAFPNPFAATTDISFSLSKRSPVRLEVLDVVGRHIKTLASETLEEGKHTVVFDAANFPNGNYLVTLRIENDTYASWITLAK